MTKTEKPCRVALVTGGVSGIGAAASIALTEQGATVIATTIPHDARGEAFEDETGIPVRYWSVRDRDACLNGVKRVEREFGPIDILVNDAGVVHDSSFARMTIDAWLEVIDTNLNGCFHMCQAVYPNMVARGWGRIVNVAAMAGQAGLYGQANFAAAKAGILGLTRALAIEAGRSGITVNAVAPGYTDTATAEKLPHSELQAILADTPVGRLARPEEIAACIAFLCSEQASFVTGETLSVNGGAYMA